MLKLIAVVVLVAVGGVLLYAAARPDVFRVSRSAVIEASSERIFPLINDLRRFNEWSPYSRKDPGMKLTYTGPAVGVGAASAWEGNREVGAGRLAIVESAPPSRVTMSLDMRAPIEAHNVVEFSLEPRGDATRVTWAMHGPVPYLAKIVHLFLDVDRMVGGDFEAGLANLKAMAEQ